MSLTPRAVMVRLEAVPPLRLQAVELLLDFDALERAGQISPALLDAQDDIEAALAELNLHTRRMQETVRRWQRLQPTCSQQLPDGF